jgi:EmrB/QacA subfamily drug resistance transporter
MDTGPQRARHQVTFAVLSVGVMAFALLQSLVIPVLPTIQEALHTNQTNVTWVLTAYLLSASISTPIMGRLGDMKGKKKMFVIALAALALGSVIAALTTSLLVMILARVVQGVGGGVLPLAFGIIRDEFPAAKVGGAVGSIAALTSVGAGAGVVLAGPIVDVLGYRWLFWVPVIMTGIAGLAAYFLIPESRVRTAGKVNWVTALMLSGWLVALLLAVSQGPNWGWGSPRVLVLLIVAAVVIVLWVVTESRSSNPLIDMKMMRIRAVWAANLVALLMGIGMYAAFGFLPQFLQTPTSAGYGFGASVTESGLMMLPNTIGMFFLGLWSGRLAARFGSRNILVIGSAIATIGYLAIAFFHDSELEIYLAMSVVGIGFGLAFSSMSNVVVQAVPAEQTGVASGMNANIRTIGGSLGAAVMASVVAVGASPSGVPVESGYTHGFLMLAVAVGLAAVAALCIPPIVKNKSTHLEDPADFAHPELAIVAGGTVVGIKSE